MRRFSHMVVFAVIADGYTYDVETHGRDDDSCLGSRYWYSLRNMEVDCPCNGEEEDCGRCEGTGHATGEPFSVFYFLVTEEEAEEVKTGADNQGDGYERTSYLETWRKGHKRGDRCALNWEP